MPNQSPTERELLIDVQLGNIQDARNKLGEIVVKINELKKGYKALSDQQKQSEVTTGEYTKSINLLNTDKSSLLKTIRELTIAQRQETLNLKAADDSIIGMRGSLAALKDEYIRLGKAAREGIGGTDLLAKISKLNAEVSKAEQSMGVFSRNVGNYKSGFNGLSNSINQVAREMPNFAQSATIGFMALSNNLPILADEIQRVRQANALLVADGKPTVSVFKQIATSIFSWQSALITVISLSVIYAKEIGNFIFGTKKATESTDAQAKAQEKLNQEIQDYIDLVDNVNKQRRVDVLGNVINGADAAYSSLVDLKEALKSYQEQLDQLRVKRTDMGDYFLVTDEDKKSFEEQKKNLQRNIDLLQAEIDKRTKKKIEKTKKEAVDTKKIEEDNQKELLALIEQYHEQNLELIDDKYVLAYAKELEQHHRIKDALKTDADDTIEIRNQKNLNLEREEIRHQKAMAEINPEAVKTGKIDLVKPKGTYSPDISKQLKDKEDADKKIKEVEDKNRQLAIDAAINAAKQTVDAIAQIKQQELDRQLKRELTAIQRNADGQDRILENRLKNGIISEGQYNDAKQKLNEETAAKELEANRKAFEEKKRLDTATAIANGALAITSILAQYPKFDYGIAAAIAIGASIATTATQVAVIQAQKFALGGKVQGKSHAEGGVMIEAEGGEGMINKNSMRSTQVMQAIGTPSQIASAINMSGGGISWETGATLNSPNRNMFNSRSENSTITYSQMAGLMQELKNGINSKKVVILESEITKTQNKVKAYETSGRF